MSLVPGIVDSITVFTEKLEDLARRREPFRLEEITTRYVSCLRACGCAERCGLHLTSTD
jgi:hypothetical protein